MKNAVKMLFLFACITTSVVANAAELTEATVKRLIEKVDRAAVTLNVGDVSDALSNDAVIIMNVKMQGQNHVMKPSKNEYIEMLQQGWSAYKNYKYSKSNVIIKMQGNKAIVTSNVKESMTVDGKDISGESKEEVTIELVNGNPLITKVVGYTSM